MSTFAVVTCDTEVDLEFAGNGALVLTLTPSWGDQRPVVVDFDHVEARALRDWLVKVVPDA